MNKQISCFSSLAYEFWLTNQFGFGNRPYHILDYGNTDEIAHVELFKVIFVCCI